MIGSTLAHYVITEHLGTGGMGEVYQATDGKLGRSVALKLLPEAFAQDEERVARFEREARVLASLNHPRIAAIYGLEDSGGRKFLIMELVQGETLAARLARGALQLHEAIKVGVQIAEGLQAAHDNGIVHRDLKPANIKIAPDGSVKVLDFGLAKAYASDTSNAATSHSPTISAAATRAGVILGTAAYMSPEQAKGRAVDRRSDIWAFGCVLYEMVTGRRAFAGEDVPEILAAIIAKDPDWTALPAASTPAITKLIRRCLAKDLKKRLGDAGDARLELEEALTDGPVETVVTRPISRAARFAKVALLAFVLLILGFAGGLILNPARPAVNAFQATLLTPQGVRVFDVALSPDGRRIAFVGLNTEGRGIWVRETDSPDWHPLPGAKSAIGLFWSPDSQYVAFFADGKMKKVPAAGGPVLTVCDCAGEFGSWGAGDVILFVPRVFSPLFRVSASGGTPTPATMLDIATGETSHSSPVFLPNGHHFLYHVEGKSSPPATYVGELDSTDRIRLLEGDNLGASVQFAQGHLVYARDDTLVAQPFDVKRLSLEGEPAPIAEHVRIGKNFWYGRLPVFTISQTGVLVTQTGPLLSRLVWFDRSGKPVGEVGGKQEYVGDLELSPDGSRLAVSIADARRSHVWLVNLASSAFTQFTFGSGEELGLRWSPDGRRAIYRSIRPQAKGGAYGLYQKSTDGGGGEELVLQSERPIYPDGWTRDERTMFYEEDDPKLNWGLWQMSLPDRKASPFLQTEQRQEYNRLSRDERWVAYQSSETGVYEIFATTFPKSEAKWRVSAGGGVFPRWRRDGRELFYVRRDNTLMVAAIDTTASGVRVTSVRPLFQIPSTGSNYPYDVAADGLRFLVNALDEESTFTPLTLRTNWLAGIGK